MSADSALARPGWPEVIVGLLILTIVARPTVTVHSVVNLPTIPVMVLTSGMG